MTPDGGVHRHAAFHTGWTTDDRALYLWDPSRPGEALREGDTIDSRHVAQFSALISRDFGGLAGLNQNGEVVARIQFVEPGGDGVYLIRLEPVLDAPPPPPPFSNPLALRVGPNPVASSGVEVTWIAPRDRPASVRVLDPTGRLVRTLDPGAGSTRWTLEDMHGTRVAPGIYIVVLESGGERRARRVAVVR
jgi:hypothetical protein